MIANKRCEFCGKSFTPASNAQKYCKGPHYMNCPVCGRKYLVKNNENLKGSPVACSQKCKAVRSMRNRNSLEALDKSKKTMVERFGVEYAMQSDAVMEKSISTLKEKYGVDNIQKVPEIAQAARKTQYHNWALKLKKEFPLKIPKVEKGPMFRIDEADMQVFLLKEKASVTFLKRYGHRINPKFGRIHTSLGLVDDGMLYQVLRFERKDGHIVLADFGTRGNYFNPNYYSKIMDAAIDVIGIEEFTCYIPRSIAVPEVIQSLSVELEEEGHYVPYWVLDDKLKKVTMRDNISEMKKKCDYITTDYLDKYKYVKNGYVLSNYATENIKYNLSDIVKDIKKGSGIKPEPF